MDESHRNGAKPVISRKTRLPDCTATTARTLPPRRVDSQGPNRHAMPIIKEPRPKSKPKSESLMLKRAL